MDLDSINFELKYNKATSIENVAGGLSEYELVEWLSLGEKEDVKCAIKEFEVAEMYEEASIANNYLKTI